MIDKIYDDNDIAGTGTRLQYDLAGAYPELRVRMQQFFATQVAKCPWLPDDWLVRVRTVQAEYPKDLLVIHRKDWGNVEANAAWSAVADTSRKIVMDYAAQKSADGREELQRIADDNDFWSTVYKVSVKTGVDIASGVHEGIQDVRAVGKNLSLIVTVVAVAVALYFVSPYVGSLKSLVKKG